MPSQALPHTPSITSVSAPWKPRLQSALASRSPNFFQLATVDAPATPCVRTVQLQGFLGDHPAAFNPLLLPHHDFRSTAVAPAVVSTDSELLYFAADKNLGLQTPAAAEACIFIEPGRMQYRIRGRVVTVSMADESGRKEVEHRLGAEWNWPTELGNAWRKLDGAAKLRFGGEGPGVPTGFGIVVVLPEEVEEVSGERESCTAWTLKTAGKAKGWVESERY